jgi:hypothetical protein
MSKLPIRDGSRGCALCRYSGFRIDRWCTGTREPGVGVQVWAVWLRREAALRLARPCLRPL